MASVLDPETPQAILNLFSADEWDSIPEEPRKKVQDLLNNLSADICSSQSQIACLNSITCQRDELETLNKDYKAKLDAYELNVQELRLQLDIVSKERTHLLTAATERLEEMNSLRQEKNAALNDSESLRMNISRLNDKLERCDTDLNALKRQLEAVTMEKFEIHGKLESLSEKENELNFKERLQEQEKILMLSNIESLEETVRRYSAEINNMRSQSSTSKVILESKLSAKEEELRLTILERDQYKKTIENLTEKAQELNEKMQLQYQETAKCIESYKKEIESKTKLAEIYKSEIEDNETANKELQDALVEYKRMLSYAEQQHGELETKLKAEMLKHEQEIEEKNKVIESLKHEILHANELLKEVHNQSMEEVISKIAPSAAIASRLIKPDMSLTELYSLYVKTSEELQIQKRENTRIDRQLKEILDQLGENAPIMKRQELEHDKLIEMNRILTHHRDELLEKNNELQNMLANANTKIECDERDFKKMRQSHNDLGRQVCFLLKEVEQLRSGHSGQASAHVGPMRTPSEVIAKKLITFHNIEELQTNNQKLIMLVRDLSLKIEELEAEKEAADEASYKAKIESYAEKAERMQESLNKQNTTICNLLAKCERYKKLYFDLHKKYSSKKDLTADEISDSEEKMDTDDAKKPSANQPKDSTLNNDRAEFMQIEQQLNEAKAQYQALKEQYDYYLMENKNNAKIVNEQCDKLRAEVRELTCNNCKLMSDITHAQEQLKLQNKNIATYKQQIATLEARNKNYDGVIMKHEQTLIYLKDELLNAQTQLSKAESDVNILRNENRAVKETNARLQVERESLYRERQNQNLLMANLDLIKANLERKDTDGQERAERRYDDALREISGMRRRHQEEVEDLKSNIAELNRQLATFKDRLEEEKVNYEKIQSEAAALRDEITKKNNQIDVLSKKLQKSLTPSKNDPISEANARVKALEAKVENVLEDNQSLKIELENLQRQRDDYCEMSNKAESEIRKLHESHSDYMAKVETELKELRALRDSHKARIEELESEIQLGTIVESAETNETDKLKRSDEDLKTALQKLNHANKELRELRMEHNQVIASLNAVEVKYANEMALHSADIQEMAKVKTEIVKLQDVITKLTQERDSIRSEYEKLCNAEVQGTEQLETEKRELEGRINDLEELNKSLHIQIEHFAKMSFSQPMDTSTNGESSMNMSSISFNHSQSENDVHSVQELLKIVKYVRKERDVCIAKLDIMKAENLRMQSERSIQQKKIDELTNQLNQASKQSDTENSSDARHNEIIRKIETLNALTDSNRILREERDIFSMRIKEQKESIDRLEKELVPIQNSNRELLSKVEELTAENQSLRIEAVKWRQRANTLVEKNNKNPEEFKRLQSERENVAKMLINEKEITKQVQEELNSIKSEKIRLEQELSNNQKQLLLFVEEKKKLIEEVNTSKSSQTRLSQESLDLKNKLLQKEEIMQKLSEELESKEAQLQDTRNKESQIRKIAKRYKDSYNQLVEEKKNALMNEGSTSSQDNLEGNGSETAPAPIEELMQLRSTIENREGVIRTLKEELEKIRNDNEQMKVSSEMLREARNQNAILKDAKTKVEQELAKTKLKLEGLMKHAEEYENVLSTIKNNCDETVARVEKDLHDQGAQLRDTVNRLTREIESLHMRNNQLSRQLGLQQSSKPSTSSGAISDKNCMTDSSPRTANVKPMSGSTTVQQSATVTPWRGSETPLASIRPISVQNSRTAAILPTSQQNTGSSSTSSTSSSSSATLASAGCSNTALVPPQQQVHTTGSGNNIESMASSSPTSSHTDYLPSTSSASVAVAAIPPMGSSSAAESSQEAESIQQPQGNDPQSIVSGGPQQVVALVSPRVEGSSPGVQLPIVVVQQEPINQQPSTSGSTNSSSQTAVSSHSRHSSSNNNVTTSQAGSSGAHKRPRDVEGDSSTSTDESGGSDKSKHIKRLRQSGEAAVLGVSESGVDVEYQVPTSSQRDQEDDIVLLDSEDEENTVDEGTAEADVGPTAIDVENERYEDLYEQDQEMDEEEGPEINESHMQDDADNEVDVDECADEKVHCTSEDNQAEMASDAATTSQAAATSHTRNEQLENNQSQTISSGSSEFLPNVSQPGPSTKKQATSSTCPQWQQRGSSALKQDLNKETETTNIEISGTNVSEESMEGTAPSPQESHKFDMADGAAGADAKASINASRNFGDEVESGQEEKTKNEGTEDANKSSSSSLQKSDNITGEAEEEGDEDDESGSPPDGSAETEVHASNAASQSEVATGNRNEGEGADGVSSEGEKQATEDDIEEGREAEASTTPVNTRSKSTRGDFHSGRTRSTSRGGPNRRPIIWQENDHGHPLRHNPRQQNLEQLGGNQQRMYRGQQRAQRSNRGRRGSQNYSPQRF